MKLKKTLLAAAVAAIAALTLGSCSAMPQESAVVTVRLWDQNVADAYEKSFDQLYRETGVKAVTKVIPWADYWTQLRVDLASKTADDIFWVNAGNFAEYAENSLLRPITSAEFAEQWPDWDSSVIAQYSLDGSLWGVPQLSDPGIGLLYNKDLLDEFGVTVDQVKSLTWNPNAPTDSLREISQLLTRDSENRAASDPKFDANRVNTYGFNAAFDLNAIVLNFLGSNHAAWQKEDTFAFNTAEGVETFQYLVDLINKYRVSPPASDTNPPAGSDLSRDLFIQGKMALFETGAYNLANVLEGADFNWGIATIPSGPKGAISVTNGIVAAASTSTENAAAQLTVLKWLGGKGSRFIGESGSALTAVKSSRESYFSYWKSQRIDVAPMVEVLGNGNVQAPRGAKYGEAEAAYLPFFTEMFLGKITVPKALEQAESAANQSMLGK